MKPARRSIRHSGRGTIVLITGLLIGSALIRIGDGVGQALARAADAERVLRPSETVENCKTPEDLRGVLAAFSERESRLLAREAALDDRMQALKVADETVAERLSELEQAEAALRETIALADTAAEGDLERLTKVYENMKPKQAAALFEEMNPNFAAGFLGRMRPEAAAEIMAGLSPEAAHVFSVVLAGRNAEVPRD